MPLSKARDRERKRQSRLDKRLSTPYQLDPVQPNHIDKEEQPELPGVAYMDADGNPVYDD